MSNSPRLYGGRPVDPKHLIETFGTLGLLAIIFAETGLLIGFFLPGDSLLFTARLLLAASAAGGLLWSVGVTLAGYALGKSVHNVDRYLLPIIAVIVAVSFVPIFMEYRKSRQP